MMEEKKEFAICESDYYKLLRRLLCGDGKNKGLNCGRLMLSEIKTITRRDWKNVRIACRCLNQDMRIEMVKITENVEDGKIRTYYELNPDYEIVENFGKIIIRLKEVEV